MKKLTSSWNSRYKINQHYRKKITYLKCDFKCWLHKIQTLSKAKNSATQKVAMDHKNIVWNKGQAYAHIPKFLFILINKLNVYLRYAFDSFSNWVSSKWYTKLPLLIENYLIRYTFIPYILSLFILTNNYVYFIN